MNQSVNTLVKRPLFILLAAGWLIAIASGLSFEITVLAYLVLMVVFITGLACLFRKGKRWLGFANFISFFLLCGMVNGNYERLEPPKHKQERLAKEAAENKEKEIQEKAESVKNTAVEVKNQKIEKQRVAKYGKFEYESKNFRVYGVKEESDDLGLYYITGTALNTNNKNYSYVHVSAKFMDKDGTVIGSNFTNVNDISAGQAWKFKILSPEDSISYQLTEITAY